jgi:hypothetical protein
MFVTVAKARTLGPFDLYYRVKMRKAIVKHCPYLVV